MAISPSYFNSISTQFKEVCNDIEDMQIMDIVATNIQSVVEIVVIANLNHFHIPVKVAYHTYTFHLEYNGNEYADMYHPETELVNNRILKFNIPVNHIRDITAVDITVVNEDLMRRYMYNSIYVDNCHRYVYNLTVSAYTDLCNSIPSLILWVEYMKLQQVDHIVWYLRRPYPELMATFRQEIASGYIHVFNWEWIGTTVNEWPQENNQIASMNSGFYRYRYWTQFFMICDIDEFPYSESHPFRLFDAIQQLWDKEQYDIGEMQNAFFFSHDQVDSEEAIKKMTLFDDLILCHILPVVMRTKMVIHHSFTGLLGIHIGTGYAKQVFFDPKSILVAHYKRGIHMLYSEINMSMKVYSDPIRSAVTHHPEYHTFKTR